MFVVALVILVLLTIALIMRFVLPELVYTVRAAIVRVRVTEAILARQSGEAVRGRLGTLLVRDYRYECAIARDEDVVERITKLRELFHVLTWHRADAAGHRGRDPQACIVELGGIVENLGREIRPNTKYDDPVVEAHDLLAHIARRAGGMAQDAPALDGSALERWFSVHPASIRQITEVLSCAALAMVYRLRRQNSKSQ